MRIEWSAHTVADLEAISAYVEQDPAAALILAAAAALPCSLTARRAGRIDLVEARRSE